MTVAINYTGQQEFFCQGGTQWHPVEFLWTFLPGLWFEWQQCLWICYCNWCVIRIILFHLFFSFFNFILIVDTVTDVLISPLLCWHSPCSLFPLLITHCGLCIYVLWLISPLSFTQSPPHAPPTALSVLRIYASSALCHLNSQLKVLISNYCDSDTHAHIRPHIAKST